VAGLTAVSLWLPAAAFSGEPVDISGTWHRNARLSDDPRAVMKAAMAKAGERGGGSGRRGGPGMPGGWNPWRWRTRWWPTWRWPARWRPARRTRRRADGPGGFRDLLSATETLSIEVERAEVRLDAGAGRASYPAARRAQAGA